MKVDVDILEKIAQYMDGDLSEEDKKTIAYKIKNDKEYQFHKRVYDNIIKGIEQPPNVNRPSAYDLDDPKLQEEITNLLGQERLNQKYKNLLLAAVIVFVVGIGIWGGQKNWLTTESDSSTIAENDLNTTLPEDEIPLGSSGIEKRMIKSIPYLSLSKMAGKDLESTESGKVLVLREHDHIIPAYSFRDDSLNLFVKDIEALMNSQLSMIELNRDTKSPLLYLHIDGMYFHIHQSISRQFLGTETNSEILNLLSQ